jgi:hypothetical protein
MKSRALFPLAALLAVLLLTGATWFAWWERGQAPATELIVEVLPEEILEVEPPDWDALVQEMENANAGEDEESADETTPANQGEQP